MRGNPVRQVVGEPVRRLRSELDRLPPQRANIAYGWELTLECGHVVHRTGRYRFRDTARRQARRDPADLQPPPQKAHCEVCGTTP